MVDKQEIKEEALSKSRTSPQQEDIEKPLPKIKFSEEEMEEFALSLATGKPFSKSFSHPKAPNFVLEFRDKTKKEGDLIGRSLDRLMEAKKILNWVEYTHAFNMASVYYQLESVNGIPNVKEYPESIYKEFDVLEAIEKSVISQWTSSQVYIAMGFMFQLNQALLEASKEAFGDENFS
jgi:hypothetical protein